MAFYFPHYVFHVLIKNSLLWKIGKKGIFCYIFVRVPKLFLVHQFLLCLMCLVTVAMEKPQKVLDFADSAHFNFRTWS